MNAKKEWELAEAMTLGVFDEDNWVTINGTHVLIGEGGEIKGGPGALKNYKKGEKSSKKSDGKTTSSFSRKDGESYRDFMNRSAKEANSMITAGKSEGAMGPKDIDAALSKGGEKELADSLDKLPVGSKVSFSGEDTFGEFETYAVKWDSDRWYAISKYTSGNEKGQWFNETKTSPGSNIAYWANRSQEDKPKDEMSKDSASEEMSLIMDMMAGDYSPDQPRDENGMWTSGGGATYSETDYASSTDKINEISFSMNNGGEVGERWKEVRDILKGLPEGTVMTQTLDRGYKVQYTKTGSDEWTGTDGYKTNSKTASMSWVGYGHKPYVSFTGKDDAPSLEDIKSSQTAAVNGQLSQWLAGAEAKRKGRY